MWWYHRQHIVVWYTDAEHFINKIGNLGDNPMGICMPMLDRSGQAELYNDNNNANNQI